MRGSPVVAAGLVARRLLDLMMVEKLTLWFIRVVLSGIVLVCEDSGPVLGRNYLLLLFSQDRTVVGND